MSLYSLEGAQLDGAGFEPRWRGHFDPEDAWHAIDGCEERLGGHDAVPQKQVELPRKLVIQFDCTTQKRQESVGAGNWDMNMQGSQSSGEARWRILCIDDEPDILKVVRIALSTRHEVVTAGGGTEALRIIEAVEPDFVICDVRMPDMDGYATVSAIRRLPKYAMVPVFFLTAEKGKDAAKLGYEAGCNLYLYKPFDAPRLLKNIDYFTKESELRIRPKSHAFSELESVLGPLRRGEAKPAAAGAGRAAAAREPVFDSGPVAPPSPAPSPRKTAGEDRAEYEAMIADRKRREQEYWKRRYAHIQAFIDENS